MKSQIMQDTSRLVQDEERELDLNDENNLGSLIEPELAKRRFGKDNALVYIAYGDGKKTVTAPVTLNAKRTIDLLVRETFDRAQKLTPNKDIVTKFSIRVGDLMNTLRVTHTNEIKTVMENLSRTPVRLDFLGDRARAKAVTLSEGAKAIGKTDKARQAELMAEAKSVSMASTILSYSHFAMKDREPFELGSDLPPAETWSRDDIVIISWGPTVVELLKDPSNAFSLIDSAVKELISSKHAYSLYDILIAELFRQQGIRDPRYEKITSRPFSLAKCHSMLATDMRSEKAFYRTDPLFDITKEPYKSSGLKEGGLRYFKKEILNPAIQSINADTNLEVEYTVDPGRRKDRNIYFHIRRKTDSTTINATDGEGLQKIKSIEGMSETAADLLAANYPDELLQAAYWEYKKSEQTAHAKGNLINRPARYLEKIIKNIKEATDDSTRQVGLFEPGEIAPPEPIYASEQEKLLCERFSSTVLNGLIEPHEVIKAYSDYCDEKQIDIQLYLTLSSKRDNEEFAQWIKEKYGD